MDIENEKKAGTSSWGKWIIIGVAAVVFIAVWLKFGLDSGTLAVSVSDGRQWLLPIVAVAATLDSVNPCAFSVLFLTIAFLFSLDVSRSRILRIGGLFILGIFLVYVLIGLGVLQALSIFGAPNIAAKVGASLLVAAGLIALLGHFFPSFPIKLRIPQGAHRIMAVLMQKGSFSAAFLLGGVVGLFEFPCTGGPYLMVLGLLHDQATVIRGVAYLLFYNFIFVLPLLLILGLASNVGFLEKMQVWRARESSSLRLWSGLAMTALGFIIFLL